MIRRGEVQRNRIVDAAANSPRVQKPLQLAPTPGAHHEKVKHVLSIGGDLWGYDAAPGQGSS